MRRVPPMLLGCLACATIAHAAVVTVADGDFADPDWEVVVSSYRDTGGPVPGGTATGIQTPGGNPGSMRTVANHVAAAPSPTEYSSTFGVNLRKGFTYDPSTQGALGTIDYAEDAKMIDAPQLAGFALRQGGNVWVVRVTVFDTPTWTRVHRESMVPANFELMTADGLSSAVHPDFSAAGGPMEVGFLSANSNGPGGSSYTITGAVDNWVVRFNPPCATAADCDDADACTTDACVAGVCSDTPVACNDGDPCTSDACVGGACESTPISCDDGKPCTLDACSGGTCTSTPLADEALVASRIDALLAVVNGRACAGDTLVKAVAKKLARKLTKARAKIARADSATRAALIAKLLDRADGLLAAARTLLDAAVRRGVVSAPCGGALGGLLDEIRECVAGVPGQ